MEKSTSKCKKCKRVGEKIFLKGEKCSSPKCPITRSASKQTRKGSMGRAKRKNLSEYGTQLAEKQKAKFGYGLREKQFKNYVKLAAGKGTSNTPAEIYNLLESRLDNTVFRIGLADSRNVARQMVSHGHILVNGGKVDIPSYKTKIGEKISVRPQSVGKGLFKDIDLKLKKYTPPLWIILDKEKLVGEIKSVPSFSDEPAIEARLITVVEFYNR